MKEVINTKCGLKLINYDDMLYPQLEHKFEKTITPDVWDALQTEAAARLKEHPDWTHPNVVSHWQSIVDGKVPFGYSVQEG
jgi:hypothetical protein